MQNADISNTHNTEFRSSKIKGSDVTTSLILTASHYTRLIQSEVKNATNGIDFRGSGSAGAENWTSLIYLENTAVDAPTKFLNYADPSYNASVNNMSANSKGLKYISVLTDYPQIKTLANPAGDGNVSGWFQVENSKNLIIEGYTTAELQSASNAINAIRNKWVGRPVLNTTVNKFMKARGTSTTSTWVSDDGATTITPV